METIIEILFCVIFEIYCIKKLIRDRRDDKINDWIYEQENFKNPPCIAESEHCDYCGTDDCMYHPNNN